MSLEDVYYFSVKKRQHQELFNLVERVVKDSENEKSDKTEMQRRLEILSRSNGTEHIRQASNFVAEAATFNLLKQLGESPHWVPELVGKKMPDLEVGNYPVEVKHLNSPRVEHEALANTGTYGGDVNNEYHLGLGKKIGDFIADARLKFESYNLLKNGNGERRGTLYLFFSRSIDASITDGIEWEAKMHDRVEMIAGSHLTKNDSITLVIKDIDRILE